jgi:hypothetical protein
MAKLTWDGPGQRKFETGVDHGILFPSGGDGVAWNGLTTVTETPAGADNTKTYADNIMYGAIRAAETFGGTVEAYMCPREFLECDGFVIVNGVAVGQQARKPFDLYYRTKVGSDLDPDAGFKHHFGYGLTTSPSEKAYGTVNDSPEMTSLSWEFESTPVAFLDVDFDDLRPTSRLTIDSTDPAADPTLLAALLVIVEGAVGVDPRMPTPDEVLNAMGTGLTVVNMLTLANQPSYNSGTHVITIPVVTGVTWKINGEDVSTGAQPALAVGEVAEVTAHAAAGYTLSGDTDWSYEY